MGRPTVVLAVVADSRLARDLGAGGVFVHGCELAINEECDLAIRVGQDEIRVDARAVYIDGRGGAGLELLGFDPAMKARLTAFTASPPPPRTATPPPVTPGILNPDGSLRSTAGTVRTSDHGIRASDGSIRTSDGIRDPADNPFAELELSDEPLSLAHQGDELWLRDRTVPDLARDPSDFDGLELAGGSDDLTDRQSALADDLTSDEHIEFDFEDDRGDGDGDEDDADAEEADHVEGAEDDADPAGAARRKIPLNMRERLRGLTLAEQIRKANSGDPNERITLERMYGKNVWEALLRNPRLTSPEVARIARMGTLPRIMIEAIVGNGAWLQIPEVRRALLVNPRLGTDQILRVLRLMPRHEIKLAAQQTAYPHAVRDVAKRLARENP
jgi:hypothetical protein